MVMRVRIRVAVLLMVTIGAGIPAVHSQGFSVSSHSACMAGRALAGSAAPCPDASSIFFNPAGLARLPGTVSVGIDAVGLSGEYHPDGGGATVEQTSSFTPIPHLYINGRLSERIALGIGFFVPYGLSIEWPEEFRGSFVGYRGKITGRYLQPTVAVAVTPTLSVGGGVDVVRSDVALHQALDLAPTVAASTPAGPVTFGDLGVPTGTAFADAELTGNAWAVTWNIGLLWHATDRVTVGARYLAETTNRFESGRAEFAQRPTGIALGAANPFGVPPGTPLDALLAAQFAPAGPLARQSASTAITYPGQALFGVRLQGTSALMVAADYMWTGWSAYDEIVVDFERLENATIIQDYENAHTLRVGGELELSRPLLLRAGMAHNTVAAPDVTVTPLLPEGARTTYSAGARFGRSRWMVDGFGSYVRQGSRRGRLLPRPDRDIPAEELNEGTFSGSAFELGLTITYRPGAR